MLSTSSSDSLVALQAHLSVLTELSSSLHKARSQTKSLFRTVNYRDALDDVTRFSGSLLVPASQEALRVSSLAESADGSEVDAYRRIISKPVVPITRCVGASSAAVFCLRA